ncbi:unnamed protein product [Hermetia illucens]|uniref:pyridoxal 5'-phosphate synthase n=1 Tax=Hermetia illucens TaxID=343691 RepID=A0A7R8YZN7_HERIL|nr:pyridoxine/pyridoxamine 5'-phosphate oxidase-like [Hermetia illucens]CAD7091764.1 unnamed protein product [Hermetia illucens]
MKAIISDVSRIVNSPSNPFELFLLFLSVIDQNPILVNVATVDPVDGVASVSGVFQGWEDDTFRFSAERASRTYRNTKTNPKVAVTFFFDTIINQTQVTRQILVNGNARELSEKEIKPYWYMQELHTRIKSHICDCSTPLHWKVIKSEHDKVLDDFLLGVNNLGQTATFTLYEVIPTRMEFLEAQPFHIADRIIYSKLRKGTWRKERICC